MSASVDNFFRFERYVYLHSKKIYGKRAQMLGLSTQFRVGDGETAEDYSDAHQFGRAKLWEACLRYETDRKKRELSNEEIEAYNEYAKQNNLSLKPLIPISSFSTYAYMFLGCEYQNEVLKCIKSQKLIDPELTQSYTEASSSEDDEIKDSIPTFMYTNNYSSEDEIILKIDLVNYLNTLDDIEKEIFNRYFCEGEKIVSLKEDKKLYNIEKTIKKIRKELIARGVLK